MPLGRAFNQSLQGALDRAQQRKAERATQRFRQQQLQQRAEQARKQRLQDQRQFEAQQEMTERRLDLQEEQQEFNREQQVAQSMQTMFQNAQDARFRDRRLDIMRDRVDAQIDQMQQERKRDGQMPPRERLGVRARTQAFRGRGLVPSDLGLEEEGLSDPETLKQRAGTLAAALNQFQQAARRTPMLGADQRSVIQGQVAEGMSSAQTKLQTLFKGLQREINKRNERMKQKKDTIGTRMSQARIPSAPNNQDPPTEGREPFVLSDEKRVRLAKEVAQLRKVRESLAPVAKQTRQMMKAIPVSTEEGLSTSERLQRRVTQKIAQEGLPEDTEQLLDFHSEFRKASSE